MKLLPVDFAIIAAYFMGIVALGLWLSRRKSKTGKDFFLAGRQMKWPYIGASMFSANISSQQFVGQAGLAFTVGIIAGGFQLIGAMCFMLLAVFFLQTYMGLKLNTSPEFFERRYSSGCRTIVSLINVLMVAMAGLAAALYAGATVMTHLLGWDVGPNANAMFWAAILLIGVATALYTLLGGLRAVIYCDFVMMLILVLGGALTLCYAVAEVGGLASVLSFRDPKGEPMWTLLHPWDHKFGWLPMLTGTVILGVHGHCTDQDYIQRALSAGNLYHARMGALFGGFLKIVALFIIAAPGVVAAQIFQHQLPHGDSAYAALLARVMPHGMLGLCLAGLLAAIMSTVDSGLCACSSLLTYDFFAKLRKNADERMLVRAGRIIMVVLITACVLGAPQIRKFPGLYIYLIDVWGLLAPPVFVCVVFGLFYRRANAKGAFTTLAVGLTLGILTFITFRSGDPTPLTAADLKRAAPLIARIDAATDPVSQHLKGRLSEKTMNLIQAFGADAATTAPLAEALTAELNATLNDAAFYRPERFAQLSLSAEVLAMAEQAPRGRRLALLNRRLLEAAYPNDIPRARVNVFHQLYMAAPPYLLNPLNACFVITLICTAVMLLVSHLTPHTAEDQRRAAYVRQSRAIEPMTADETRKYRLALGALLALWLAVVAFFSLQ